MSKLPFWIPPQDAVTQSPPVIRFTGIRDDDPRATELARAHGPRIQQFYIAAARSHALGTVDISRRQAEIAPGLSAEYVNMQGQETVTVTVAERVPRSSRPTRTQRLADWAVARFDVPTSYTYTGVPNDGEYITSVVRLHAQLPGGVLLSRFRGGIGFFEDFEVTSRISWAGAHPTYPVEIAAGAQEDDGYLSCGLLVDLRPYHSPGNVPPLAVQVYMMVERLTYEQTGWVNEVASTTTNSGLTPDPGAGFDDRLDNWVSLGYPLNNPSIYYQGVVRAFSGGGSIVYNLTHSTTLGTPAIPFTQINGSTTTETGEIFRYYELEYDPDTGVLTAQRSVGIFGYENSGGGGVNGVYAYTETLYNVIPVNGQVSRISEEAVIVSGLVVWGTPDWRSHRRDTSFPLTSIQYDGVWATQNGELSLPEIGTATSPRPREFRYDVTEDPITLDVPDPPTLLGTLTIDIERGAVTWAAA